MQDTQPLPINTWTHVAVTYNHASGLMTMYRNGAAVATRSCVSDPSYSSWTGGRATTLFNYAGSLSYAGCSDRIQQYNVGLTASDVQALYSSQYVVPVTGAPTTPAPTAPPTTTAPTTAAPTLAPYTGPPTIRPTQTPPATPMNTPVTYHGGMLMLGTVNVYLVFYGDFAGLNPAALTIIPEFVSNLGGSALWNSVTSHYQMVNGVKTYMSNSLVYQGYATDNYTYNKTLADSTIYYIIKHAINVGALPQDTNGIYLVLTAPDVDLSSGLCKQFCGWHTSGTLNSKRLRYGVVGSASRCGGCQSGSRPNGDVNSDSMVSTVWHELMETATDPDFTAWYDSNGYENADRCAWSWGQTYAAANGQPANIKLGQRDYLVQQNLVQYAGGYCVNYW